MPSQKQRKWRCNLGLMKSLAMKHQEVCRFCKGTFCDDCSISVRLENDLVRLKGVNGEIEEVQKDFFKEG